MSSSVLNADGLHATLTHKIIGAAMRVHRVLGPGFTEAVYHAAMTAELTRQGIPFESQREFEVWYEGTLAGTFRPDLVVDNKVIIEFKAVSELSSAHKAQTLSYLKASDLRVALLINFGEESLVVKRLVN